MMRGFYRYLKRKFWTKNFFNYFITGIIFTLLNVVLVWLFVDYYPLLAQPYNTPFVTFVTIMVLFIFRYFVFQWIGFTQKD